MTNRGLHDFFFPLFLNQETRECMVEGRKKETDEEKEVMVDK